ncbi:TauD/TfdA family dioxygenase [Pseudoalteromonas sp. JBTF-M23]|uniref:TauD/TfdA family dioxygenase n=1 Tax=Pseudoalteromonas caenipelagi TaxID=2726988 RepID=A0A849VCC4_9GAMM|nr:TauD/TfdA family dioxygenase [Pseudoalteromonas caenipelagi]NOU51319.1 TauD/TfdA family dioxygenase [Pseudoalteromonas caenipelagi]
MKFDKWRNKKAASPAQGGGELVSTLFLEESPTLPLVYRSNVPDVDLSIWYEKNEQAILANLDKYGAVLFRGFKVNSQSDFQSVVTKMIPQTAEYVEGATPRTQLNDGIYTATEFPADQEIAPHNELSYTMNPPDKLVFCCLQAPESGGQTQIVDVSKVYQRIDSKIINEFNDRNGWLLCRNYGTGFGPTVSKAFGMDNVEDIKAYGEKRNLKVTIISDTQVKTEQVRDAVHSHPKSGDKLWFNHISFWHPSSLCPTIRATMESSLGLSGLPYHTYFGDGSPIDDTTIDEIRQAYADEECKFDWREGDVMLLDNWKVAHGRKPFTGNRSVLVSMG